MIAFSAVFAGGGALAGAGGAVLCGRLRRGVPLPLPVAAVPVAALWVLVALADPPVWWLPVPLALSWVGVLLAATDLRAHRLPDALTLPAAAVGAGLVAVAAVGAGDPAVLLRALAGAACWSGGYLLVRTVTHGGLGAGDCKLAISLGAVAAAVSWSGLLLAMLLTTVLSATAAVVALLGSRRDLTHGPAMLLGAWVVVAFGSP